ncbi:MAG TPA: hypothetical protein O0W81_04875 [Methanocorpusculum sp.]|nr:hypothetical protein [Methanocorpusculum sp.]
MAGEAFSALQPPMRGREHDTIYKWIDACKKERESAPGAGEEIARSGEEEGRYLAHAGFSVEALGRDVQLIGPVLQHDCEYNASPVIST